MYERILVATDGSALSDQAVNSAIDLALLAQAELFVINVAHLHVAGFFEGSLLLSQADISRLGQETDAESEQVVAAVRDKAKARGVRQVTALVVRSEGVSESIIEAARVHECDLIVMASHGRRGIKRLLMGSETLHVLTHSHIPVLVLR
jgi:nucleotide-binding universal stress UspA family protein